MRGCNALFRHVMVFDDLSWLAVVCFGSQISYKGPQKVKMAVSDRFQWQWSQAMAEWAGFIYGQSLVLTQVIVCAKQVSL